MRKVESIPFKDFMSGDYDLRIKKVKEIRKGKIYKVVLVSGLTFMVLFTGDIMSVAHAAGTNTVGIEKGASELYRMLLVVGKWIIIGKGAFETISKLLESDHAGAKRGFLTYLVVYVILHGLPWALGQVDGIFNNMPVDGMEGPK